MDLDRSANLPTNFSCYLPTLQVRARCHTSHFTGDHKDLVALMLTCRFLTRMVISLSVASSMNTVPGPRNVRAYGLPYSREFTCSGSPTTFSTSSFPTLFYFPKFNFSLILSQ